ncbi:MAG: hypothetical protein ACWGQW_05655 [bacterium]
MEATLNPLNGLTGVDFNDQNRRVTWYSRFLDDLNKFGPSVWTPFQWATAYALKLQGEDDAAARWAGRLFPQTAAIKALVTSGIAVGRDQLGLPVDNFRVAPGVGINEIDPSVLFFSQGIDPYERARVGNAMGELMDLGYDPATLYDQAYAQQGDLWDLATELAIRKRTFGQTASALFGVGFKGRNQFELQMERAYNEMRLIKAQRDGGLMSPEQYRLAWRELDQKYPFMDLVLLSKRAGVERDEAFAWNVLDRVPPARSDDMFEAMGLNRELLNMFYENNGDLTKLPETDRNVFMARIASLAAVLDLPDDATRDEWNQAKDGYRAMQGYIEDQFGDDIWNRIDGFWVHKQTSNDEAYAYLAANPEVQQAMNLREQILLGDPVLSQYYASVDMLERYYNGLMYDEIGKEVGEDIWDKWNKLDDLGSLSNQAKKEYSAQHQSEFDKYIALRDMYKKIISDEIVKIGQTLPEPTFPMIRQGTPDSVRQDIIEAMQPQQTVLDLGWEDFRQEMGQNVQRLVLDYVYRDLPLSYNTEKSLDYIAEQFDISTEMMLRLIERDLTR